MFAKTKRAKNVNFGGPELFYILLREKHEEAKLDVQNVEREASKSDYANGTRAAAATRFHFNLRVFVLCRSSHTMTSAELR